MRALFLFLFALTAALPAQDGPQLYTLYCSACHGPEGEGATGGTFPPLAESPWVLGDPDRSAKIILQGLHGPVDVGGKTYNLEMPPQGAMLPDDQIAAILTHVRASWGNQADPVSIAQVAAIRAATKDRKTPWTAPELLKLHPLPFEKTALTNLLSQVFPGEWSSIPDFSTLQAVNIEEEHDGIITLADSTLDENYAMLWRADFNAPVDGEYQFLVDADDAAKVFIGDKSIAEIRGAGPMDGSRARRGRINLTRGTHPIRVEYLQMTGQQGIAIGWRAPGARQWKWLTESTSTPRRVREPIPITPVDNRPVIYRNFITGTSPRAIGVGFPGGLNLAWSADHLAPALIWTGAFIDGAPKWIERGTDPSPPAGDNVVTLSESSPLPTGARFRGYKLDPAGNPTFSVQLGDQFLLDAWCAESGTLQRTLTLTGIGSSLDLPLAAKPEGLVTIEHAGAPAATAKLVPGKPVVLTYRWK